MGMENEFNKNKINKAGLRNFCSFGTDKVTPEVLCTTLPYVKHLFKKRYKYSK